MEMTCMEACAGGYYMDHLLDDQYIVEHHVQI